MSSQCKRCLLHQLSREAFASVYEYIAQLPPEVRASEGEYHRRLALCQDCDSLMNGMCSHCGCFVEVRAAKRLTGCPGVPPRW